jgi:hypothetical protein
MVRRIGSGLSKRRSHARATCMVVLGLSVLRADLAGAQPAPSTPAASTPAQTEGTVMTVEKEDIVLDLGTARGALSDDVVEIWRPLRLKHPVTGRIVTDRFLIGRLRITQVRPALSLARPEGTLERAPEAGDIVILSKAPPGAPAASGPVPLAPLPSAGGTAPPTTVPATAHAAPPSSSSPHLDDDAVRLSGLFESLQGSDVTTRIRAYEAYVLAHPQSRYARVLWEEAKQLRGLLEQGDNPAQPAERRPPPLTAEMTALPIVVAREPLRIAIAVHGTITGAVLHVRTTGAPTYASQPMVKVGTEYWAGVVPGEQVEGPGFEFFIEAVTPDGTRPLVGDATLPQHAEVEDVLPKPPSRVLGQAQIWTDYASFNAKDANDYVWQTEGFMGARLDDVGIRAVRTGFGVYRGVGGTLHELDELHLTPRSVGLTYGYLEAEFGITPIVSIGGRGVVGLREDGVGGGGLAFFRIGSDLKTNLWLGGEVLGGIGLRGITQFEWNSFRMWPIVLRTEVTNQPAGVAVTPSAPGQSPQASEAGDVGVRAIVQVGYRILPHLVISGRASYQGRTINHAGPGAGAAVAYAW